MGSEEILSTEDLITPERLAKGDFTAVRNHRGRVSHVVPNNLTIMKELIRRGIFPLYYESYGVGFLELRNAFNSRSAVRCSAVLLEQWGLGVSESWANQTYLDICKILKNHRIAVIEFVLEENKAQEDKKNHSVYRECFEILRSVMDEEQKKASEREKDRNPYASRLE